MLTTLRRRVRRPSPAMVVATLALAVAAGGIAWAAIPGPNGVFTACYATSAGLVPSPHERGDVRLVQPGEACRSYEARTTWNQRGPSDAYHASRDFSTHLSAWPGRTEVLTLDVPAGNYVISMSGVGANLSPERVEVSCFLEGIPGDNGFDDGNASLLPLMHVRQGIATVATTTTGTFTTAGTIAMRCSQFGAATDTSVVMRRARLTAIAVGALH